MTARIFLKLIAGVICLMVLALVAVDLFVSRVVEATYVDELRNAMVEKARVVMLSSPGPPVEDRARLETFARTVGARITVVAPDGKVLGDSEANPERMENHRTRPELRQAFRGETGSAIRHSATLGVNFLYVAIPVPAGALRLAMPLSELDRQVNGIRRKIFAATILAFLPAFVIAAFLARFLSRRLGSIIDFAGELARGNFRVRLPRLGSGEFGELARTLNETGEKLEQTVDQLQAEHTALERLERVRKDFVINVSHELRTPLASIQGYAETLMDGALHDRENNMRFLGIIRHNAERLARLTEDLLTLSRIEMKRRDFRFDTYEVNELVAEAVDTVRPIARKKMVLVEVVRAPAGSEVYCDEEAVSQVLSNLLDNAIKYTPEGGLITVGVQPEDPWMQIYVRDSGAGIPAEDLPRLFERFYRVDKARSRALGGTGLGLSIVKHLVLAHGGRVWVESRVGEGATFRFTLPTSEFSKQPPQLNSEFMAS